MKRLKNFVKKQETRDFKRLLDDLLVSSLYILCYDDDSDDSDDDFFL